MTLFISLDMENWMSLEEIFANLTNTDTNELALSTPPPPEDEGPFGNPLELLLNFSLSSYIMDPSTYSDPKKALLDQAALTQCLIVATNYNWSIITTEATISAAGNTDAFEVSAEWNRNGLLSQAYLKSDGVTAITINYAPEKEIPGYEITMIIIIIPLTVVGIIYYIRKRNFEY